jgi:1-deoxy-D-xylulose 5-phosphate reductoisomerase
MSDGVAGEPVFRYTSAGSFRIALLALTRNEAKRDPTRDAQTRQRLFCFNRLLSRVFSHPEAANGTWALKGAASLMARLREARASKDVDIATKESLDAAERVLREAAATSTGDFL